MDRSQALASHRAFKQLAREVNAALPKLGVTRPLRWSKYATTFDSSDQLKCAATAGALRVLYSPIISNVLVTKTLIDGGAGLNVLSVQTFNRLQVPYDQLQPTKPFSGVTDDSMHPIGQVRLRVTFDKRATTTPSSSTSTLMTFACRTMPSSGTQPYPISWRR